MDLEHKEIERKFILEDGMGETILKMARDSEHEEEQLEQFYISLEPEVRLRKSIGSRKEEVTLTIKSGKGIERTEVEIPMEIDRYDALKSQAIGHVIKKTRTTLTGIKNPISIDKYNMEGNPMNGMMVAEVEFDTIDEANNYQVPSLFGAEVTEDERYKNKNLAANGLAKV